MMPDDDDKPDLFGRIPYRGEPPFVEGSATSEAAAKRIKYRKGPLHFAIKDFLRKNPRGATDERMQDEIPMPANTQRPRRVELTEMGEVVDSSRRTMTRAKREAVIWVLRENRDPTLTNPAQSSSPPPPTNASYDAMGRLIKEKCGVVGCAKSPAFSIGFFPRRGQLGMWYCQEHWEALK